ncbi:MAG: DegT/DnrJ/EryC1/StrS family aminotransferase [Magnetococcales bacterium]|nr:DegT/DnrJ/EryC1/StrS family aminotransferase [Magnetococcales bacterium]
MIPSWRIEVGQEAAEAVARAMAREHISMGVETERFEKELANLLDVPHAVCFPSGTAGLLVSLLAVGVGPGDEVIVPVRTWIATANAAALLGARVVLVDCTPERPVIDPEQVDKVLTPRTKAILPVHLNGRAADLEALRELAAPRKIALIEDACQAFLSRHPDGEYLGRAGRFGCFSLGIAKLLTTGQGGFVVCHTSEDHDRLRRIRNQGFLGTSQVDPETLLGGNFKFTDLQSAMGLAQLPKLKRRIEHQRRLFNAYREGLAGLDWIRLAPVDLEGGEVPLRAECLCPRRGAFTQAMERAGIQVKPLGRNVDQYPHFAGQGPFPRAASLDQQLVMLPSGPEQPLENVQETIRVMRLLDGNFAPSR